MAGDTADTWDLLWNRAEQFRRSLTKSRAVNVNSRTLRIAAKELVQYYFRETRPGLVSLGLAETHLEPLDAAMQDLLGLANAIRAKRSYVLNLRSLRTLRAKAEPERELLIGARKSAPPSSVRAEVTGIEDRILQTLGRLVPSAALSYEQAIRDLKDLQRKSYRGAAAELREVLREVLDHLAPDKEVMKSEGFQLEKGRTTPTMKQKVKFLLKSRGVPSGALDTPQYATQLVEEITASLARSVYDRGSLASHVTSTRQEVEQVRLYADGVLCELLQVH